MLHVKSAGKSEASVFDLLIAMMDESNAFCVSLLLQQGVDKLLIVEEVTAMSAPQHKEQSLNEQQENALAKYTLDLIALAKQKQIDPLIGRADEVKRVMQVLCRRKKNNPLLVGEPGVGKTAIVEGLAAKISEVGANHYALSLFTHTGYCAGTRTGRCSLAGLAGRGSRRG